MNLYFSRYDTYVDRKSGRIIDVCDCLPHEQCVFKTSWERDGRKEFLNKSQMEVLALEELLDLIPASRCRNTQMDHILIVINKLTRSISKSQDSCLNEFVRLLERATLELEKI